MFKESDMKPTSNGAVLLFMVILSTVCAVILASLASVLQKPQAIALELDRSKQQLIAAKMFSFGGTFLMQNEKGEFIPAKLNEEGAFVPGSASDIATTEQVIRVIQERLSPKLVDSQGKMYTFEELKINKADYLKEFKKTGYYKQPYKLLYEILPFEKGGKPEGYIFPINGFGLWDAIYGYLAVKSDGNTVIGTSWYDQKETPGLGANISEPEWQSLFPGKRIFQESPDGKTNFKEAPLGITVVKGKVSEVLGNSPKALSAVDGMAGATLTGNGVTLAYKDSLQPYRPFLLTLQNSGEKK
jgi:Na+-transporting NADH:ubiquinone oxidoreductase subunit C